MYIESILPHNIQDIANKTKAASHSFSRTRRKKKYYLLYTLSTLCAIITLAWYRGGSLFCLYYELYITAVHGNSYFRQQMCRGGLCTRLDQSVYIYSEREEKVKFLDARLFFSLVLLLDNAPAFCLSLAAKRASPVIIECNLAKLRREILCREHLSLFEFS